MKLSNELNEKYVLLSHNVKSSNELNIGSYYMNDGNSITNDALQTNVFSCFFIYAFLSRDDDNSRTVN